MKLHKFHLEALEIRRALAADLDLLAVCDELVVPADASESDSDLALEFDSSTDLPTTDGEVNPADCPEDAQIRETPEIDPQAADEIFAEIVEMPDDGREELGRLDVEFMYVLSTLDGTTGDDSAESEVEEGEPAVEEFGSVDDLGEGEIVTFGSPEILTPAEPASENDVTDDVMEVSEEPAEKPSTPNNELDDTVPVLYFDPQTPETDEEEPPTEEEVPVIVTMMPDDVATSTPTPRRWLFFSRGSRPITGAPRENQSSSADPVALPSETTSPVNRGFRFGIDARFRTMARTQLGNYGPDANTESPGSTENGNSVGNPFAARRRRSFR